MSQRDALAQDTWGMFVGAPIANKPLAEDTWGIFGIALAVPAPPAPPALPPGIGAGGGEPDEVFAIEEPRPPIPRRRMTIAQLAALILALEDDDPL